MHYRHSYHAGNFADVLKHSLLCGLLENLSRKDAPWCYIDTHAGAGGYDLGGLGAAATGESQAGIGRLASAIGVADAASAPGILATYLAQVRAYGGAIPQAYPGSPLLAMALARPQDRVVLCERVPEVANDLRQIVGRHATVHLRDGYEAASLLPPAEKRGLILIDPPFERSDELEAMADFIAAATRRFAGGIYAAWYPIKNLHTASKFRRRVARETQRPVLDILLDVDIDAPSSTGPLRSRALEAPRPGAERIPVKKNRMSACGLLVVNPPFGFESQARESLAFLAAHLAQGPQPKWHVEIVKPS